jgi:hypothetical protein
VAWRRRHRLANGVLREETYGRSVSERAAHQLSGVTAIAAFALYFSALDARWSLHDAREAVEVGMGWPALTVAFEFGFGRLVAKQSWDELLADHEVAEGRTWPFVLAWIAAGPAAVRTLRGPAARG